MAQNDKTKKEMNKAVANALWGLLTISVEYFKASIKRHADDLTKNPPTTGHDFLGYASVNIRLNTAFFAPLLEAAKTSPVLAAFAQRLLLAIEGFKFGIYSIEVKRFRKSGKFNVSPKRIKGDDDEWRPQALPLTSEQYAVLEMAVLKDERVKAAIAQCDTLPIPAPITGQVQGAVQAGGQNPFGGQTVSNEAPFGS